MKLFEIKKQIPQWLLVEAASPSKTIHIEHLEDLIISGGYAGAEAAIKYVEQLREMLADGAGTSTKLTVKWDGSPAIVCGIDPDDSKFFVGTKSAFSKGEPKRCKTDADVDKWYAPQPDLAAKLKLSLHYLSKLGIGGIIQGDLMFTEGDVTTVTVNNEDCYVFTPNTITYAVPVNSQLGKQIARAKIGIIFHTSYDGFDINTSKYGYSTQSLRPHADVWFDDATYKDYTGIASLTPTENNTIQQHINAVNTTMQKIGAERFDIILTDKGFNKLVKSFVVKLVNSGSHVNTVNPLVFLQKLMDYYSADVMTGVETLAGGPDGKLAQKRLQKIKDKEQWISDNSNTLLGVLATYKRVIELKNLLLSKLHQVEGIGTFQRTNDGYKVTTPEGFVAIGHDGGAVKLVDRLEFSRMNAIKR